MIIMAGKNKRRNTRNRSQKSLRRRRLRAKKYKSSKWKLNYPKYFKEINEFPYIVRRKKLLKG